MSPDRRPLPRGRHNLPPGAVRASQRERLLAAMLASVGTRGYEATTVPQVVAAARVSRNSFYALFGDKLDCFLALCDDRASAMLDDISTTTETDWISALRVGTARYLEWWQADPEFSRTYFVELPAAGTRALEQRDRQYERFAELFEGIASWARVQDPELPAVHPLAARAVVFAITELIAAEVRAGRTDHLTDLEPELVDLMVLLLAGGGASVQATRRPAARGAHDASRGG